MITELTVENLAIIERTQVRFDAGFTVLSGETGAGKSLLIDAIQLVLGGRADTDLIRTGAQRLSVTGIFSAGEVTREVLATGRSQARIDGKPVAVGALREFGRMAVNLCGQHDHQSLLNPELHLGYLDSYAGAPGLAALADYQAALAHFREAERRLNELRKGVRDREQRIDLLDYQILEIESADIVPGEFDEHEQRLTRLKHAERLAEAAFGALEALTEAEVNAIELVGQAQKLTDSAVRFDDSIEPIATALASAQSALSDVTYQLRDYAESLEADPKEADERQARLDVLKRLRRKYGADENEVLAFLATAQRDRALIDDADATEDQLVALLETARQSMQKAGGVLTAIRREAGTAFAEETARHLRDLAMDRARFSVAIRLAEPTDTGLDQVEFFFSANLGEDERPLAKIASGGEISRVMLAIKTALAGRGGVPTLIFDEVDAGLSGRASMAVARKLAELGQSYQVLVISHSPQIAGMADHHFRIEKTEQLGRVTTQVRRLEGTEREHEIARLISGDRVTEVALASARELLGL
jgi:DNA repair protein RecN (Recombination protein N)